MDVANVMGSRPDGWWRDRAGAAVRLHEELVRLAASGRPVPLGTAGPRDETGPQDQPGRPGFVMVLEGAAKAAAVRISPAGPAPDGEVRPGEVRPGEVRPGEVRPGEVRVVQARGSGDDTIVAVVRELHGQRVVVTADRELRDRCVAAGAAVMGPGWLLGLLRGLTWPQPAEICCDPWSGPGVSGHPARSTGWPLPLSGQRSRAPERAS